MNLDFKRTPSLLFVFMALPLLIFGLLSENDRLYEIGRLFVDIAFILIIVNSIKNKIIKRP